MQRLILNARYMVHVSYLNEMMIPHIKPNDVIFWFFKNIYIFKKDINFVLNYNCKCLYSTTPLKIKNNSIILASHIKPNDICFSSDQVCSSQTKKISNTSKKLENQSVDGVTKSKTRYF